MDGCVEDVMELGKVNVGDEELEGGRCVRNGGGRRRRPGRGAVTCCGVQVWRMSARRVVKAREVVLAAMQGYGGHAGACRGIVKVARCGGCSRYANPCVGLLQGREDVEEGGGVLENLCGELFEPLRSGRCGFAAHGYLHGVTNTLQADLST